MLNMLLFLSLATILCTQSAAVSRVSLLDDLAFRHGFRLSAVRSSIHPVEIGTVLQVAPEHPPKWRLAQWGTRYSLEDATEQRRDDGTLVLANAGKTVKIYPGGLAGEGIWLAVHGGAEYDGRLRQQGEAWPHLLIEQSLDCTPVRGMTALEFHVEFNVKTCAPATDSALNPGLHTAHITAFWTIHNKNPDSPDYNNMIWFGLPLFDARHPIPPGHQAVDSGQDDATGKFICTIEGARFFDEPIVTGRWRRLACDMLPLVREALETSQKHGFLTDSVFADLAITSFNLGWEVPGPYDCAILLRGLKLEAVVQDGSSPDAPN